MKPLDLSKRPPRSPWETLDTLLMMPRTIDKMRAAMSGGNLGQYKMAGMSALLLQTIGVDQGSLQAIVESAGDEDDVARWLRGNARGDAYEQANRLLSELRICDLEELAHFYSRYPKARSLPLATRLFDLLVRDDEENFAHTDVS